MRIISGIHKGKRLLAPKNLPVRPTTDMAKESLFNILNNYYYFDECRVLDLFAGTGNISLEFASRQCKSVTSIDQHAGCIHHIHKTADALDLPVLAYKSNVFSFLEKHQQQYDIIFADPPYDFNQEQFTKIVSLVFQNKLLEEKGTLIIEHSKHTALEELPYFWEKRSYGGSCFSFFDY